jgi:hypothetical protein
VKQSRSAEAGLPKQEYRELECHRAGEELTFGESDSISVEVVEPVHGPQGGLHVSKSSSSQGWTYHDVHVKLPNKLDLLGICLLCETRVIGIGIGCLFID